MRYIDTNAFKHRNKMTWTKETFRHYGMGYYAIDVRVHAPYRHEKVSREEAFWDMKLDPQSDTPQGIVARLIDWLIRE